MAGISSMGIGSGLDINSLVKQLVAAERAPTQRRIDNKQADLQSRLSAYGSLKSALSKFQSSVQDLTKIDAFRTMKATSVDEDIIGVSASAGAQTGRFDIQVTNLARSQSVASDAFTSKTDPVGSGKLIFKFGTVGADDGAGFSQDPESSTKTVTIDPSANSLADIRDAVNEAETGVTASIINDGSGERLVFTADETGAANGFVVETEDADGNHTDNAGLSQLAFNENAAGGMSRKRAGEDAQLIVNGLSISRSSNEFSDVVDGVTLTLKDTSTTALRVDVARDTEAVKGKIEGFVKAYNSFQTQVRQLSSYNSETQKASALTGDALLRNVDSTLRRAMTGTLDVLDGDAVRALSDLGIMTKRDGSLEVDSDKLDKALKDNFELVGALFASTGLPSSEGIEYVKGTGATEPGKYGVNVTQVATKGYLSGSVVAGFPLTVDDSNDQLRVKIDGVESGSIVLGRGSYTAEQFALELQSKINGDSKLSDKDKTVTVDYDDAGRLVIHSSSYGSESTVELISADDGFTGAFGVSGEGAAGVDVQGTIGGVAADGEGQFLIGAEGTAAEGLRLRITGDAAGDRGVVTFSRGLMAALDDQLDAFLKSDGIFASTTKGIEDQLDNLSEDRDRLDHRMEKVEARLVAQFTAMDALVAQLNSTGSFLSSQLAGLQAFTKTGNSG